MDHVSFLPVCMYVKVLAGQIYGTIGILLYGRKNTSMYNFIALKSKKSFSAYKRSKISLLTIKLTFVYICLITI